MVGERVLCLPGQRDPVDEKQNAGDDAASTRQFTNAAAVRVLPVPVAVSTSSLRRPRDTAADSASLHSI